MVGRLASCSVGCGGWLFLVWVRGFLLVSFCRWMGYRVPFKRFRVLNGAVRPGVSPTLRLHQMLKFLLEDLDTHSQGGCFSCLFHLEEVFLGFWKSHGSCLSAARDSWSRRGAVLSQFAFCFSLS